MIATEVQRTPHVHRWTRDEYYGIAALGFFEGRHVELIEGNVIEMSPMGTAHATAVGLVSDTLRPSLSPGFFDRCQQPLDLAEISEPEPDVAFIAGHRRDYGQSHPDRASLIVEVSDSSLDYDRKEKASLYAKAGILDYWIVNLVDRCLEVRRDPAPDPAATHGFDYATVIVLGPADTLSPLAKPQAVVRVADLLP